MAESRTVRSSIRCASLAFALLLLSTAGSFSPAALAQAPVTNTEPQEERKAEQKDQQDDLQTFKVSVDVVNVFFNVKDKHGMLVPNLPKDDFELYEDGQKQTIKYFSTESNQPL